MPGVNDWTLEPCKVLDRIFEEYGSKGPWREKVQEHFEKEIQHSGVLERLPWVNESPLHQLRGGQLVRFRGMIQDMQGNEFFSEIYEVKNNSGSRRLVPGRYKDVIECGVGEILITSSPECETGERLVYYCVPVPGETDWVKQVYQDQNPLMPDPSTSCGTMRQKRPATDYLDTLDDGTAAGQASHVESMDTEEGGEERKRARGEGWEASATQREGQEGASTSTSSSATSTTPDLNFPLPGMKGTPALVKLYSDKGYSLNDVIEVVAVLSVNPALAPTPQDQAETLDLWGRADGEEAGHSVPPSLVPRLHVITARCMPHTNPLVTSSPQSVPPASEVLEVRELLRGVLLEACLGDALAAEYLICHLLSSVYCRQDVLVLGKYCVNLSQISRRLQDQQYPVFLYGLLARLVTQAHLLPLSLNNINTGNFVPKKDYQSDRLVSGLLQLSQHTHLVVDETSLSVGQVDTRGMSNLKALGNVITWQKVDYDFQYHNIEQHSNIPVLVLSEGRSLISCDVEVRLVPQHLDVTAAASRVDALLTPDTLRKLRTYLTTARLAPYTLPDDMQKMVQEDFLESRRGTERLSASVLHQLLVLSRLVTLSCGEASLTADLWNKTKMLESERKARHPPPTTAES